VCRLVCGLACGLADGVRIPVDSLCSLGRQQLILGELKVLLSVAGARPAGHAFPRLHLCRVVEAEVVVPAQNHPVALVTTGTGGHA